MALKQDKLKFKILVLGFSPYKQKNRIVAIPAGTILQITLKLLPTVTGGGVDACFGEEIYESAGVTDIPFVMTFPDATIGGETAFTKPSDYRQARVTKVEYQTTVAGEKTFVEAKIKYVGMVNAPVAQDGLRRFDWSTYSLSHTVLYLSSLGY